MSFELGGDRTCALTITLHSPSAFAKACVALSVTRATLEPDNLFEEIVSYRRAENDSWVIDEMHTYLDVSHALTRWHTDDRMGHPI